VSSAAGSVGLRFLLLSDFNAEPLADFLNNRETDPVCEIRVAPFGQVTPSLLEIGAGQKATDEYDGVIVWTRPEAVIAGYDRLLRGGTDRADTIRAEVEGFASIIVNAAARLRYLFFVTWTEPSFRRNFGIWSMRPEGSSLTLMRMHVELCDRLAQHSNIFILNSNAWFAEAGRKSWNFKLWYLAKIPFSPDVFEAAAADFKSAFRAIQGRSRKLIVLDLDDTLWGGVAGEVGWENVRLGGHDAIGEAFVDFQKALKTLNQTGVVLGIVSKNDESVALEVIDRHPEMVLRRSDFAAWRINWTDKAQNIVDIANELNLDLSSVVYIDDSPAERNRIRSALPAVAVPEWPQDIFLYPASLMEMRYFDKASITVEDRQRSSMYVVDRERSHARQHFQSVQDWLESLEMEVFVETLSRSNLARAAQLFNKTNQMNLASRRLSETELLNWSEAAGNELRVFRVSDKFGDYGLTGIIGLELNGGNALIRDYLLSCRVMGRGVEQLMLGMAIDSARSRGAAEIRAEYIPTAKNAPCLSFFKNVSKFDCASDRLFKWRIHDDYPFPHHIVVKS
jgi:FkbH-like protein